jgi:hypothetical protein
MLTASIRHRRRLEYLFSFPGKSWWEFGAVRLRSKKRSCQQSSGNVFADLGLRDAGEKQTRVRLAVAIQELKKLIKLIVSLFGSVPQWLITLVAMIDELLKLLQSVRLPALASALSRMNMQERILLARLNRENTAHDQVENNEPNIESV